MRDAPELSEAEAFFRDKIPLTRAMQVRVVPHADGFAVEAPVAPNHNHLQTAFGGSINAIATLAAYGFVWLELRDSAAEVVVAESSIKFRAPILETICAICTAPAPAELASFKATFAAKGKARLSLKVRVEENGAVAAEFAGTFVAIRRHRG